jgi:hypothetical protein
MCLCIFSKFLYETFLILRTEQYMITNAYWSSCKVPITLVRSYWNLNYLNRFSKNTQIPNSMKICPVGAEVFHVDGQIDRQTDMMKLGWWWSLMSTCTHVLININSTTLLSMCCTTVMHTHRSGKSKIGTPLNANQPFSFTSCTNVMGHA